jgi:hypothetical protein
METSTLVGELGQLPWESTELSLMEVCLCYVDAVAAFAVTTDARVRTYRMLAQKTKLFFSGPITNISTTCNSTLDANSTLAALAACDDESRKTGLSQLLKLIDVDSDLDSFCSIILFVSLLRVIQVCRSCIACVGNALFLHILTMGDGSAQRCTPDWRCSQEPLARHLTTYSMPLF